MQNNKKGSKHEKGRFPRVGISILHGIAMDKCSKSADTYPTEFRYKPWYVSFPPRIARNKLCAPPGELKYHVVLGEAHYAPLNRCIYVRFIARQINSRFHVKVIFKNALFS